ncbi:MAG: ATP-binding protein [Chitinophagales bacterium]
MKVFVFYFFLFWMTTTTSLDVAIAQNQEIDSLTQVLKYIDGSKVRVDILNQLSEAYWYNNTKQAIQEGNLALELAEEIGYEQGIATAFYNLGVSYLVISDFGSALEYLQKSQTLFEEMKDQKGVARSLNYIGATYQQRGNDTLALDYHLKSLRIFEGITDDKGLSSCYNNVAVIHANQGNYPKSLEYFYLSLHIAEKNKDSLRMAFQYNNIATIYQFEKNDSSAMIYYIKAKAISEKIGDLMGVGFGYLGIAQVCHEGVKHECAVENFLAAYDVFKNLEAVFNLAEAQVHLSEIYALIGENDKAMAYAEEGLELSKSIGSLQFVTKLYQNLSAIYANQGDYQKALEAQNNNLLYKDSLYNKQKLETIKDLQTSFELQQKEIENEILEANLNKKLVQNYALMGTVGLVLLFAFALFRSQKKIKKAFSLLTLQKEKIEDQNKAISEQSHKMEEQNHQLSQLAEKLATKNESLNHFTRMASHDLKEPLRNITGLAELMQMNFEGDSENIEFVKFIKDAADRMNHLLEDLIAFARADIGTTHALETVDLNKVLEATKANLRLKIEDTQTQIEHDELPKVAAHFTPIMQLFQNLIANGIKYQKADNQPHIHISVQPNGAKYTISISDNGIGMDPSNLKKIFEPFKRLHTRSEYDGSGLGLATCKKIAEHYGEKIWVESEPDVGTTFYFTLPKATIRVSAITA